MIALETINNYIQHHVGFTPDKEECVLRLIDFMYHNKSTDFFPLDKIVKLSKCNGDLDAFKIATFLCGSKLNLLRPVYSYVNYDDSEVLLTKREFNDALNVKENGSFITDDGVVLDNFRRNRLDFYFVRPNRKAAVVDGLDF